MAKEATLTLRCAGLPYLYLRNCTQELHPLLSGDMQRTVNGALVYAGSALHHKYRSVIRSHDKIAFAHDMFWRGCLIEVECIQRIREKINGSSWMLSRTPLPPSVSVKTHNGQTGVVRAIDERTLHFTQAIEDGIVSYRPLLAMRIINFQLQAEDEGATKGWQLWLEEV